ncbi:hypothetical protein B0H16DRAFT_255225 [Mycena metata]|uniref:Uncharacterized protein n=1 Tax=Mycena metata TaxID=1033252 RepID=A0AAD7NPC3_9AGAR|nr:hypothetical protein B0H16DRAFT_255225 [Mycena metata]
MGWSGILGVRIPAYVDIGPTPTKERDFGLDSASDYDYISSIDSAWLSILPTTYACILPPHLPPPVYPPYLSSLHAASPRDSPTSMRRHIRWCQASFLCTYYPSFCFVVFFLLNTYADLFLFYSSWPLVSTTFTSGRLEETGTSSILKTKGALDNTGYKAEHTPSLDNNASQR